MSQADKILARATEAVGNIDKSIIPNFMFKWAKGIAIVNFTEVGFIFSLNDGDGIVIKKNEDGTWGAPSFLEYDGAGCGAIFGKGKKTIVIFALDSYSLNQLTADVKYQIGAQVGAAAGKYGTQYEANANAGGHGANIDLTGAQYYCLSEGALLDVGIQNNFITTRNDINEAFYGKKVPAKDIVNKPGAVELPQNEALEKFRTELAALSAKKTKEADEKAGK